MRKSKRTSAPIGELEKKIARLRRMLEEFQAYKAVLREDGLVPDAADKEKESGIIKNLLSLEKQIAGTHRFKTVAGRSSSTERETDKRRPRKKAPK